MIEGSQISLRTMKPEDLNFILVCENDPDNWLISGTQTPYDRQAIIDFIAAPQDLKTNTQIRYIIERNQDLKKLGTIDLFDYDTQNRRVGVGILIQEIADRKKGYATEALQLMIDYCSHNLQLHQVYCNILPNNIASISLFEKQGFNKVGIKKDWIHHNNQYYDELLYQKILNPKQ